MAPLANFNPRTPCGVRPGCYHTGVRVVLDFNPRTPCGVRRPDCLHSVSLWRNFNPRTPCGVRLGGFYFFGGATISIHAPRVGCDPLRTGSQADGDNFNPRTPCGVRHGLGGPPPLLRGFQSTHPVWGATCPYFFLWLVLEFQSTHPVWGATKAVGGGPDKGGDFNPRTPCGVRRRRLSWSAVRPADFNPRTPCGVRRHAVGHRCSPAVISIHAPRVGCDTPAGGAGRGPNDFNPRTPCGVRLPQFQGFICRFKISIHAPRVGCDAATTLTWDSAAISIHAPRVGCDRPAAS